jgi:hypothetical protein
MLIKPRKKEKQLIFNPQREKAVPFFSEEYFPKCLTFYCPSNMSNMTLDTEKKEICSLILR